MLLERTLRLALRNYGTLFLFVATVTVTLHLVYLFVFRDVTAVSDLHPAIEAFPQSRQVRGVGRADLSAWRSGAWIVAAVEIALIPLLARGAARVLEQDEAGEVPTVAAALRAFVARGYGSFPSPRDAGPVLVTAAFGVVVWWLVRTTGMLLA
ncbi:MAG: hypothetical protein M3273_02410, partial [Actinomycetota bacterium]|nr:hypothetical protein [Actinomycetota bacterium]